MIVVVRTIMLGLTTPSGISQPQGVMISLVVLSPEATLSTNVLLAVEESLGMPCVLHCLACSMQVHAIRPCRGGVFVFY